MKYSLLFLLFWTTNPIFAQEKYFEKSLTFNAINNNGLGIVQAEHNAFLITGQTQDVTDFVWHTFVCSSDLQGNISNFKDYKKTDPNGLLVDWYTFDVCKGTDGQYAVVGRYSTVYGQSESYSYAYLMLVDEECDSTNFYALQFNTLECDAWCVAKTLDDEYILGGLALTGFEQAVPYLVRVDANGNKTLERVYTEYDGANSNNFHSVISTTDGGYILTAFINVDAVEEALSDALILKVDHEGDIVNSKIINFGFGDCPSRIIATNDGGIAVPIVRGESPFAPVSDFYGESLLMKFNANLQEEWHIEVFNDQSISKVVQLEDGSYVVCGQHKFANGMVDAAIAKIGVVDGQPQIFWHRYYGGQWSDYFYDMAESPDGGFMMVGRSDSLSVDTAYMYMVKTNCMGLLTLPEAQFAYTQNGGAVSFINQSQFVYPDSIDGGHFLWNFGDGTTSTEVNPTHTYQQPSGTYTVTLTAVVCNDTSVYQQVIDFTVGIFDVGQNNVVQVSPNPVTTQATLHYHLPNPSQAGEVKLYDLFGREQLQTALPVGQPTQTLHLSTLPRGIYVYQVSQNGEVVGSGKLVKR